MNEHETIADLIAWLRRTREGENAYLTLWRDEIADRLEAAHRRERGDAAKLREALKAVKTYLDGYTVNILELRRTVDAALSAPPRNCNVGTAQEQAERWYWRYHVGHLCQSCPLGPRKWSEVDAGTLCFSEWQQMPYEEGGGK